MFLRSIIASLIALTCSSTFGQTYWVRDVGSFGNDLVNDVKVDDAGFIYITGEFSGTAQFADDQYQAVGGLDMFVAKLNAAGDVLWWRQGGGYGNDRGLKLAFGPGNVLVVVGEFMGQADFQGVQLQSAGFTQDMFIAQLDRNTGQQQWIQQGGGDLGSDRPYGVTVSSSGQVTMAGEFRGEASWNGFTLTSMIEQDGTEPTMDVVIVSYAADGTPLWIQQGATDRQDRAIDVVSDSDGDLYVVGQFSDTITFDSTHTNAMFNATFILKLDPQGDEQWFRRCGGAVYDHVRDLLLTPDGDLLITGDLQGNMMFMDDDPDMITGQDPHNYYLMLVSKDGDYMASSQVGSENGVGARGIDLRNDTIAVIGEFNCQFTDLSTHYNGTGLWMAAGAEDVFVSRHLLGDLSFIDARQYGGPGEKQARQVASLPNGDIIGCGGFELNLSFKQLYLQPIDLDYFLGYDGAGLPDYDYSCPDSDWETWAVQDGRGLMDGFLARAFVRDSVTHDLWTRIDGQCAHDAIWSSCLGIGYELGQNCPDSITVCGGAQLRFYLPIAFSTPQYMSVGPEMEFQWSTGDTTIWIWTTTTGWYHAQASTTNGCWSWSDSVFVTVNPYPATPIIQPQYVQLCAPASATFWCSNLDTANTWVWGYYNNDYEWVVLSTNDSLTLDTTGSASFVVSTDAGCVRSTDVYFVELPQVPLPDLDLDASITFPQDTLGIDSIWICQGSSFIFQAELAWTINGDSVPFPPGLDLDWNLNGGGWSPAYDPYWINGHQYTPQNGWNTVTIGVRATNAPCGTDTMIWYFTDQIWVGLIPQTDLDITLVASSSTVCAGDSVLLTATCPDCDSYQWAGPGLGGNTSASVWVHNPGYYSCYGVPSGGTLCYYSTSATITLTEPPGPLLQSDPGDAIICPNDSVLIFTNTPGTDVVWFGPGGPVPDTDTQIWASIPGEYYVTLVDAQGCQLTSDPLLVTGYGTPFLNVAPDNILCMAGDEVVIDVVTTVPSSVVWAAPLSGNALQQTVDQPGVYSVTATACGITTSMSVTVIAAQVNADVLDPGPFTLCAGDTVVLQASPGAEWYIWSPGDVVSESLVVTEAGTYTVQAYDANGCSDASAPVVVTDHAFAQPLVITHDTICLGGTAQLSAAGNGTIQWFSDAALQDLVFVGSSFAIPDLQNDTTFFVTQSDSSCQSGAIPVHAVVIELPMSLVITGDTVGCAGSDLVLSAEAPGAIAFDWSTPGGDASGATLSIAGASAADEGTYTCTVSFGECGELSGSVSIELGQSVSVDLGPDAVLCPGGTATFNVSGAFTSILWNGVAGDSTFTTAEEGWVIVEVDDPLLCPGVDSAWVEVASFAQAIDAGPVTACSGSAVTFVATGSGVITWSFNANMVPVVATGLSFTWGQALTDTVVYATQTENGCSGSVIPVPLTVVDVPTVNVDPGLVHGCNGGALQLSATASPGAELLWSTPSGATLSGMPIIDPFSVQDTGNYIVQAFLDGCWSDTAAVFIGMVQPAALDLGPDTSYCMGASTDLVIPSTFSSPAWSTGLQGYVLEVFAPGPYVGTAIDGNGCVVQDEVLVEEEDCDPVLPNIITPNGDGSNDAWVVEAARMGGVSVELIIWNRHGSEVYRQVSQRLEFRGLNTAGEPLADGVYYYAVRLSRLAAEPREVKGYLQLRR